jgi:hypothetical protein
MRDPLLGGPLAEYAVFALRKVAESTWVSSPMRFDQTTISLSAASWRASSRCACPSAPSTDCFWHSRMSATTCGIRPRGRSPPSRRGNREFGSIATLVLEVVLREVKVSRPVWESRRLLGTAINESPLDQFVRDRAGQSLAHVFTLLSLVLPSQPLQIAFRSLHSENTRLRGTALEYLEGVLPADIRQHLWPFLVQRGAKRPSPPQHDEILANLLQSSTSVTLHGVVASR